MTLTLFGYDPTVTVSTLGGTFTRADATTCATYVDSNGVVQTVAANVLRNSHYVNGVRTTLLEGSRQNAQVRSEALDDVAWSKGASSISANAIVAPDGNTTADKIVEDGTVAAHYAANGSYGFTISTAYTLSVFAKAGERTWCYIWGRSLGLANAWFNLSAGTVGTVSGTETGVSAKIQALGNSWYRCSLTFTSTASATNSWGFGPTTADNTSSYAGNGTSGAYFWGAMAENAAAFPSSYIPTGAAAVTRAADALSFPFQYAPQAMTVYAKMIDVGESTIGPSRTGSFGNIGSTNAESFYFSTPNGKLSINHIAAAGSGASTQTAAVNAAYDTVEALGSLSAAGVPQLTYSFNGAAEVSPAAGTARALDAAWNATTVWLTGQSAAATTFYAFQKLVIASGVQSLATMRTLSATGSGATVTNALAQVAPAAEIAAFGQPGFTCMDSGTNTALSAAYTPAATQQARLFTLTVDYSAAPAAGPITVQDGETVLWRYDLSATGPFQQTFDFTRKPLRASKGAVLSVNAASPGSGVQGMITWTGDVVRAP